MTNNAFKPLEWQVDPFMDFQSPVILLTGGAGGGKSKVLAEKCVAICWRYPGAIGAVLRKTREATTNTTVPMLLEAAGYPRNPDVKYTKYEHRIDFTNGSKIIIGGMKDEAQREQIRSLNLDFVWMEEANKFTEPDFNEAKARLRGRAAPWRQIMLSTNPDSRYHWINQNLILGGGATVYVSRASDNTYNPADYLVTLDGLTGIQRARLHEGKWVEAEGAVYPDFNPNIHVVDWFDPPRDWDRIRAIDFGYKNPFVCQWWAIDPITGAMYLYREIYQSMTTITVLAKAINKLSADESYLYTVADHDAGDRAELDAAGIATIPADKEISLGIQKVTERLQINRETTEPGLYLMTGALVKYDEHLVQGKQPTSTEEEFPNYQWAPRRDGKPNKEAPIDKDNHGLDALRYAVMALDYSGQAHVLPLSEVYRDLAQVADTNQQFTRQYPDILRG